MPRSTGRSAGRRGCGSVCGADDGASEHLADLWVGLRAAVRSVLEEVSLADLVDGRLPAAVRDLVDDPDAWRPR